MGYDTKIGWCNSTWNPITGCLHGCEYCYARKQAERFGGFDHGENKEPVGIQIAFGVQELDKPKYIMRNNGLQKAPYPWSFAPTFHRYRLDEPQHWKKPRTIFVGSMCDLFGEWVPDEWIREVFAACEKAPRHRYLFLTKNPDRYIKLAKKDMLPRQHWYGYSATQENQLWRFHHADDCPCINLFVSIEPILEPMHPGFSTHTPADWVIIGAETGNRKGKVVPQRKWIDDILKECDYSGRPIFMKESLREIMGDEFRQEFPWDSDHTLTTHNGN